MSGLDDRRAAITKEIAVLMDEYVKSYPPFAATDLTAWIAVATVQRQGYPADVIMTWEDGGTTLLPAAILRTALMLWDGTTQRGGNL